MCIVLHDVNWGKPWRAEKGANGYMIALHLNDHDSCAKGRFGRDAIYIGPRIRLAALSDC